jgi:hypothetical protein
MCTLHSQRFVKYGDPRRGRLSPRERLLSNISVDANGCWNWGLTIDNQGYGRIGLKQKKGLAHRIAYQELVGPIPDGLVLDHLCRNRKCCNPSHLEPVSNRENILRGTSQSAINSAKVCCTNGHEFDAGNTRYDKLGKRHCRKCCAIRSAKYQKLKSSNLEPRA